MAREPYSPDLRIALTKNFRLREAINKNMETVRSLGDCVLLEFSPTRRKDLELREHIIHLQTQLRVLFLTKIVLWKYRAQLPGFEVHEEVRPRQKEFEEELARILENMADQLDEKTGPAPQNVEALLGRLEEAAQPGGPGQQGAPDSPSLQIFLSLCRTAATITVSLWQKPLSATVSLTRIRAVMVT